MLDWLFRRRRRALDRAGEFRNVLGTGAVFRGGVSGTENSIVYGRVEGDGEIQGSLVLAPGSHWKGTITAIHVHVAGHVDGNIVAHEKLELAPSAHVVGNLTSRRIVIAEGAVCEGMIHAPQDAATTRFSERRNGTG
ncbi:MAG: bactofilin family protein [Acidiferrobacterales bacterium]